MRDMTRKFAQKLRPLLLDQTGQLSLSWLKSPQSNWGAGLFAGASLLAILAVGYTAFSLQHDIESASTQLAGKKPAVLTAAQQVQTALGYEGFLGNLQKFLPAPTLQGAEVLRADLTKAEQAIMVLGTADASGADTHQATWRAILTLYQQYLAKAEQGLNNGQSPDPALFLPLYSSAQTLSSLTAQLQSELQTAAWQNLKNSNDTLRGLVWLVLLVSSLLVGASWVLLRGAYIKPLQTLLSALNAPSRMDKNVTLWGTDRTDLIGEVARAVEGLRQQLLNLPDMMVDGAEGLQPVKFGAAGQAVFQNLVGQLTRAAHDMRAADIPDTLQTIEQLCKALATTVAITHEDLKTTTSSIRDTSNSLYDISQLHSNRLGDLVSSLETRASTVAQIAQLTGTQVQSGLKDIVGAQMQMKLSAGQTSSMLTQYGGKIEDLSERMLAATNLLRASGKVLQETVDSVRTRMMDATSALTQTDARLTGVIEHNSARLAELAQQAETVLARGAEGQAALSSLATASERIIATAQRLESSEETLSAAITTINQQGDAFGPLAAQLQQVHDQLSQQVTSQMSDHVARQESALDKLESQADKLETIASGIDTAALEQSLSRLASLSDLTDSLGSLVGQMQDLTPQLTPQIASLGSTVERLSAMKLEDFTTLTKSLTDTSAASEMNALKLNANLQLVQNQIGTLLGNLTNEQAQLIAQIDAIHRAVNQIRLQRVDTEAAAAPDLTALTSDLSQRIDQQYQHFTTELTGFITRFEQALATPVTVSETGEADVPASAKAILARLRGSDAPAAPATPPQEIGLKDAISRVTQIKQLTGALSQAVTRQTQNMTEIMTGSDTSTDPRVLSEQAKQLITEVMNAISDLSLAAESITEAADLLDKQA